ncbi:hypothetical protein CWO01_23730 [Vibrio splendidus]|uniref:hypothetical protein n=1 Tax=Vibrio splendidus TaxID=29497 RepID=UPI000D3936D5|nr:hypothetical protein [Vibrio splendidus]PTP57482.1 hypothetical protein CWO01_23730 [Vibrio splendidus]
MELTSKQKERLDFWIKTSFHFIEYPEPCPEGFWIDRNGKFLSMYEMGLDHLKASANLVEREVNNFLKHISKSDTNMPIYEEFLIKPAQAKKAELKAIFKEKAGI